jgi:membrane-associated phospholipid phosphatase
MNAPVFLERGGAETRIGERLRAWPPPLVAAVVGLAGYVVLAALMIGLGLVITKLLTPGPVARWDESVVDWFVPRRTPTWNSVTDVASILAGTGTVMAIAAVTAAILWSRRLVREIGFLAVGFFVELSAFLTTTFLVPRSRPTVPRLDPSPVTSSFPSGHIAASIVLYVGLAIICSSHTKRWAVRAPLWTVAILLVVGVGFSRLYRGMHHPTDVGAGVFLGISALLFAILAVRSADAASRERAERATDSRAAPEASEVMA